MKSQSIRVAETLANRLRPKRSETRWTTKAAVQDSSTDRRLVNGWLIADEVTVLSLDVFDTVFVRASGSPRAHYLLLGNRLYASSSIDCTPEVFARARERAEDDVWNREDGLDARVGLFDIYDEVVRRLGMPVSDVSMLISEEESLESALLRVVPSTYRLFTAFRNRGCRTVFVSDTYYSGEFIENQLRRHEFWSDDSIVFSSADTNVSKAGGGLFDLLLESLAVDPRCVLHVGDNLHSDVAMPRSRRIRTAPIEQTRLNRYERNLTGARWSTAGMSSTFAGASRLARLDSPALSVRAQSLWDVGAGVAAPFLVGFVAWLLQKAKIHGLGRLYFISRDGQVLYEVAKSLIDSLSLDLEVSYLYASRSSVNLAATYRLDDDELAWIDRDLPYLSPRGVLKRFDIELHEVEEVLAQVGIDADDSAGSESAARTLARVRVDRRLRSLALERAADRRALVTDYLAQEGLFDETPAGLVDFGGVGSQMRSLFELIARGGRTQKPRLFLVGLDDPRDAGLTIPQNDPAWLEATECYLYDHRRGTGIRRPRGFGTCVQMFCAADHGTVIRYAGNDDYVEPLLSAQTDSALLSWGLPLVRQSILTFVDHLTIHGDLSATHMDTREATTSGIGLFWSTPTVSEAGTWGAFPFEGAQADEQQRFSLAFPYSWRYIIRRSVAREFPDLGWMHWFEGSLALSPRSIRTTLSVAERAYRALESGRTAHARALVNAIRRSLGREPR